MLRGDGSDESDNDEAVVVESMSEDAITGQFVFVAYVASRIVGVPVESRRECVHE
jgi:hypothetical protein